MATTKRKKSSILPEWKIIDFSGGMVDRVDDNLLPDNAAKDCSNVICKYIGILEKRKGQQRLNSTELPGGKIHGLYSYYDDSPTLRKLLAVSGSSLYVWNEDTGLFEELKTGLDENADMFFETCANYAVGFNGVDAPFKWDGTTLTTLANAPVDGRYPILFKEKLFVVPGSSSSQIWWSESFAPEDWPAINYWEVKAGDGDSISCLRVFLGELTIFKHRSLHSLRGTNISDFKLTEIDGRIGCVGPKAACALSSRMYFVSEDGLYVFNGVSVTPLHAERIPRLWEDINKEHLGGACAYAWDNMVWFSLPIQNQLTLQVTNNPTATGDITVTLGGISEKVTITEEDTTADDVAAKIAALEFEGWELEANTDTVTFTRKELSMRLSLSCNTDDTGITTTITEVEQSTNNLVLLFDPNNGVFWPMQGINASMFQTFHDGTELKFFTGDSELGYVNQQDVGYDDFGEPIAAYYVPKGFDTGQPEHLKKAKKAYVEDAPNQVTPATLKIARDYAEYTQYTEWIAKRNDGFVREYRAPDNNKWRYLNLKFIHNSAGNFELRGITIPYKVKRRPKGRERLA